MKKHAGRDIIFVQIHHTGRFVLSYGIGFPDFLQGIGRPHNILLLSHGFADGSYNMHTRLEYADSPAIEKLAAEDVYSYGDFCWVDFEDEDSLDALSGQELAELLYLGHMKDHLKLPFYPKLRNEFAYLAHDDGWFNKIYYRSWDPFFSMLGSVLSRKISGQKEKGFFSIRRRSDSPPVPSEVLYSYVGEMKDGLVFSIEKAARTRGTIEIPVYVMDDYYGMDAMLEEYDAKKAWPADGKIIFDRKSGRWQALAKGIE